MSANAKALIVISLLIDAAVFLTFAHYYPMLPNTVATHYGASGAPASYGPKTDLLVVPAVFLIVLATLLAALHFRYTIMEKYPYMLNLPSFVYKFGTERNREVQSMVISKVFTVYSLAIFYVSVLNLLITPAVLQVGSIADRPILPVIIATAAVFTITAFALYRRIYKGFSKTAG